MQLIQAIAKSAPRQVNTRYGQKTVIDAVSHDGQEITIWRGGDDRSPALNSITNGSRISVGMDSKGKYSLLETPGDRAAQVAHATATNEVSPLIAPSSRPMGFSANLPMEAERQLARQVAAKLPPAAPVIDAVSIAESGSIDHLAQLYLECLVKAKALCPSAPEPLALAIFSKLPTREYPSYRVGSPVSLSP